jgi:hypothetical protein
VEGSAESNEELECIDVTIILIVAVKNQSLWMELNVSPALAPTIFV